jgi:hypothetical protein
MHILVITRANAHLFNGVIHVVQRIIGFSPTSRGVETGAIGAGGLGVGATNSQEFCNR